MYENSDLPILALAEPSDRFALRHGKQQQQNTGKQKAIASKDDLRGDIVGGDSKEFIAALNGGIGAAPEQTAERSSGVGDVSTGENRY